MTYYRLYHMNPKSGHIDWFEEFDASDDVLAVLEARERQVEKAIELWQEGRKVLRLEQPAEVSAPQTYVFSSAAAG